MDARKAKIAETVSASRKLGAARAKELAKGARKVIVCKGKSVERFDGGKPTQELIAAMLGRTGNLRAPTVVAGKTVLVGFNEAAYEDALT